MCKTPYQPDMNSTLTLILNRTLLRNSTEHSIKYSRMSYVSRYIHARHVVAMAVLLSAVIVTLQRYLGPIIVSAPSHRQLRIHTFWKKTKGRQFFGTLSYVANAYNELYAFYTGKSDSLKKYKANRGDDSCPTLLPFTTSTRTFAVFVIIVRSLRCYAVSNASTNISL